MNKSEELCKLLEIKPVYVLFINIGDLDTNYVKVWNKRKYRIIADYRSQVDEEEELRDIGKEFPDFEKPENFVKLAKCIGLSIGFCGRIDKYLEKVLVVIKEAKTDIPNMYKFYLKQAQQIEWVY